MQEGKLRSVLNSEYWKYGKLGAALAILTHIILFWIYYLLEINELTYINILSITIYTLCYFLIEHERYKLVVALVFFDITLYSTLTCYYLGVESGAHYYLFIPIFLSLFMKITSPKMQALKAFSFLTLYFTFEYSAMFFTPVYQLEQIFLDNLMKFNLVLILILSAVVIYLYVLSEEKSEDILYNYATKDQLTNLNNRRYLVSIAEQEFSKRGANTLSVIIADIDYFKLLNDAYGHLYGDMVLVEVSKALEKNLRVGDSLARWGGEEFLFLLPNTNQEMALNIAKRMQEAIKKIHIPLENTHEDISVSLTYGIAQRINHEDFDQSVNRADEALYIGKEKGRNRIEVAPSGL